MVVNTELGKDMEAVTDYFEVLFWYLRRGMHEIHESQLSWPSFELDTS